jgi:hypothetical protein
MCLVDGSVNKDGSFNKSKLLLQMSCVASLACLVCLLQDSLLCMHSYKLSARSLAFWGSMFLHCRLGELL